jgi:signal transduction histidine kinase
MKTEPMARSSLSKWFALVRRSGAPRPSAPRQGFDLARWFGGIGAASDEERARNASPEANVRVRDAIDGLPVTLFEFDSNGVYTCAAGGYVGLFGITAAQIVGRSVFEFPRFVPGKTIMVRRALAGEAVSFTGIWPFGRFTIHLEPRLDASGRVSSVVGLGIGLAEATPADQQFDQVLEALRQSEARFRAMCESAPLGIYVCNPKLEVGYVNPALCALLGRRPDELIGRPWQVALGAEDADTGDALRVARKDGSPVWISLRMAEMRDDGQLLGYVGAITDITERQKLQAQLLVTERLLSVGTMAAGVAHEINNPLAVVVGNLEWVAKQLAQLNEAEPRPTSASSASVLAEVARLQKPIADAREAAGRMRAIARDLKLFSRTDEERKERVELTSVLDSAARMAWNEVRHRARLVREYGELPAVQGSEARLGQVFLNLILNAAQAIPEGHADENEIRVGARALPDQKVAIEVRDTGCGIPREIIDRIFDPFFTTKPPGVGTGLGLSICHRIVDSLGGQLDVESQPGQGSTFRVTLAIAADELPAAAAAPRTPVPPSEMRGRVLVIDDDRAMGSAIGLALGEEHDVEITTSARGALARVCAGEHYDAIVCDVMMPEMSGADFHSDLARRAPEHAARVIFLTGGAFTLPAREFLDRVPNARLDKPFDSERLRAMVNRQVARSQ